MLATQRYQPDKRAGLSGAERGSMQQVVPLYAQQHQPQDVNSQRVTGALATPQKRAAGLHADEGELPPPHELSSFPPLAFLLNTILAQLSLLRECPLKTVQYDVEKELAALLHRVSEHLVKERKVLAEKERDISIRGKKQKERARKMMTKYKYPWISCMPEPLPFIWHLTHWHA